MHPGSSFATVRAQGLGQLALRKTLTAALARAFRVLKTQAEVVLAPTRAFEVFVAVAGYSSRLSGQLQETREAAGLEDPTPLVGSSLRCELTQGVLMGVQHARAVEDPLCLDTLARARRSKA